MIDNQTNQERDSQLNADLDGISFFVGGIALVGLIIGLNIEEKPRFQETGKGYEYNISGGVASYAFLVDTNKDGVADLQIHGGAAPKGRFHGERAPSLEEKAEFHSAYTNYVSNLERTK